MSGHNKWSSIKHRKAAQDSKRQAVFNKIIREIVVAAREGGGDVKTNAALAGLCDKSRQAGMPKETMERAIARGSGAQGGENYERLTYEGRGPNGVALIITTLTDNKNRTVADIRAIFTRNNATLEANGAVTWMFERKTLLTIVKADSAPDSVMAEDALMEACMEAGADDFKTDGEIAEVFADPADMVAVRTWFNENSSYKVEDSDLAMVAKELVEITEEDVAKKVIRLIDALEDLDDVQKVYSNWTMSDEVAEKVMG